MSVKTTCLASLRRVSEATGRSASATTSFHYALGRNRLEDERRGGNPTRTQHAGRHVFPDIDKTEDCHTQPETGCPLTNWVSVTRR